MHNLRCRMPGAHFLVPELVVGFGRCPGYGNESAHRAFVCEVSDRAQIVQHLWSLSIVVAVHLQIEDCSYNGAAWDKPSTTERAHSFVADRFLP